MPLLFSCSGEADLSEVLSTIEEHQISMQRMLHNSYVGILKDKVEFWAGKLDLAQQVLGMRQEPTVGQLCISSNRLYAESFAFEELAQLQRQWIGLQSIFGSAEALEQLPDETEAFERVDGFWRAYLRKIRNEQSNVITVVEEEGLFEILEEKNKTLAAVQRKLEDYLDLKRSAFPRFYFLSREELVKIISKAKQPNALQQCFQKCFDGVHAVAVAPNGTSIEALYSEDAYKLDLLLPVNALAPVEQWFASLEEAMIESLKINLKAAIQTKVDPGVDLEQWLNEHPPQCILTAAMIHWFSRTEDALHLAHSQGELGAFQERLEDTNNEIQQLALLNSKTNVPSIQKLAQSSLVLMVHARDILSALGRAKNISPLCFEWNRQLRYYWQTDEEHCNIEQLQAKFQYRHEFLGCSSRLVITPLTDKCFVTLTSALQLGYGGAPAGPAGTGIAYTVMLKAYPLFKPYGRSFLYTRADTRHTTNVIAWDMRCYQRRALSACYAMQERLKQ
ncbi:hypothetical protein, conserved [Eimeria necatrix]|uniref:Dynein heavy chain linker domain-containing protein n=1 Tax=Eimeria necatrix TaxID=51315 RepID=U6N949_9EIME|nr:hypothetical protein, conserved [Eimeria necatrix]CDJ70401.1 hypothetical protein, conserved [Eimeria necatrix]